ncbi:MAG: choice-of-anchor Q domain-containing protein [Pirellulales bacterium]
MTGSKAKRLFHRRLRIEPLEDRRLLSITVNMLTDELDGSIVDGDISLRDAVALAPSGETIEFSVTGVINLTLGQLTINKSLTIAGPGANLLTIDASGNDPTPESRLDDDDFFNDGDGSRVFEISDGASNVLDVMIVGLTLTGGDATGGGGAIRCSENLTITASVIAGNSNSGFSGGGGAILVIRSLTVNSSTISGNSAFRGGGILASNAVTLLNSTVSDNVAIDQGGGIFAVGPVTVTSSTIATNSAGFRGGGIAVPFSDDTVTITSSTITGNTVGSAGLESFGGGIFARNVTVNSSTISENVSGYDGHGGNGGGIYAFVSANVRDSTVSNNVANFGGGVAGSDITITSSTFSGNRAGRGGGIDGDVVTVSSSTISGNLAGRGGGTNGDVVTVSSSTFWDNGAVYGGGISGNEISITSSTLSGNFADFGGGIYTNPDVAAPFKISSSTITGNSAIRGGGIYADYVFLTIQNSIVAGNSNTAIVFPAPDLRPGGSILTVRHSLIGDNRDTGLSEAPAAMPDANGNIVGGPVGGVIPPLLGPLADNGGPMLTHALLSGSPAIDTADSNFDPNAFDPPLVNDQRGAPFTRVYNGDGIGGARIDMGAVEKQPSPPAFFGDYNQNAIVDAADYTVWRNMLGQTGLTPYDGADGDGDGDITRGDYEVWKTHYGQPVPAFGADSGGGMDSEFTSNSKDRMTTTSDGAKWSSSDTSSLLAPDRPVTARPAAAVSFFVPTLAADKSTKSAFMRGNKFAISAATLNELLSAYELSPLTDSIEHGSGSWANSTWTEPADVADDIGTEAHDEAFGLLSNGGSAVFDSWQ